MVGWITHAAGMGAVAAQCQGAGGTGAQQPLRPAGGATRCVHCPPPHHPIPYTPHAPSPCILHAPAHAPLLAPAPPRYENPDQKETGRVWVKYENNHEAPLEPKLGAGYMSALGWVQGGAGGGGAGAQGVAAGGKAAGGQVGGRGVRAWWLEGSAKARCVHPFREHLWPNPPSPIPLDPAPPPHPQVPAVLGGGPHPARRGHPHGGAEGGGFLLKEPLGRFTRQPVAPIRGTPDSPWHPPCISTPHPRPAPPPARTDRG
jgi:hypothetical protein